MIEWLLLVGRICKTPSSRPFTGTFPESLQCQGLEVWGPICNRDGDYGFYDCEGYRRVKPLVRARRSKVGRTLPAVSASHFYLQAQEALVRCRNHGQHFFCALDLTYLLRYLVKYRSILNLGHIMV